MIRVIAMKKTGLYKKMLVIAIVPILLLGIVVTILCYIRFTKTIYSQARTDMRNVASGVAYAYDLANPGDYYLVKSLDDTYDLYKGDTDITGKYAIVDKFAVDSSSQVSLLYKDMRVNTTFGNTSGQRMAGVCTNKETAERVLNNGEEVFYENVSILGAKYLVLYVPLKNSDGSVIGMIEVARSVKNMKIAVLKAVWPVMVVALAGMLVAIYISLKSTREITGVLKRLQVFMNKVAGGNLQAELASDVLSRSDELGDISKSATAMQRSIRNFVETDPLTQLGNRRYIHNQLEKIMEKSETTGQPFSLAIADIDFFKKVNDTYGHNAGDEVLKAVANTLKNSMQGNGFAGRWGGEEFLVGFDKVGMYDAANHLWNTLEKIREMTVFTEGYEIKVTMTFGVVDGKKTDVETLVETADAKLYYGKQHGRNQVVTDIQEEEPEETVEEAAPEEKPVSAMEMLQAMMQESK